MTTQPLPLECPNCAHQALTVTYQVFLAVEIKDGTFATLSAQPDDASDFFVSLECGTCGFGLNASGEGQARKGDLTSNAEIVEDEELRRKFVDVADRVTEFVQTQYVTIDLPKGTTA